MDPTREPTRVVSTLETPDTCKKDFDLSTSSMPKFIQKPISPIFLLSSLSQTLRTYTFRHNAALLNLPQSFHNCTTSIIIKRMYLILISYVFRIYLLLLLFFLIKIMHLHFILGINSSVTV